VTYLCTIKYNKVLLLASEKVNRDKSSDRKDMETDEFELNSRGPSSFLTRILRLIIIIIIIIIILYVCITENPQNYTDLKEDLIGI
jgi:preprotein translocase subunit SecG